MFKLFKTFWCRLLHKHDHESYTELFEVRAEVMSICARQWCRRCGRFWQRTAIVPSINNSIQDVCTGQLVISNDGSFNEMEPLLLKPRRGRTYVTSVKEANALSAKRRKQAASKKRQATVV